MTKQSSNQLPPNNSVKNQDSPSISRPITEKYLLAIKTTAYQLQKIGKATWDGFYSFFLAYSMVFLGMISVALLVVVIVQGITFYALWQEKQALTSTREKLLGEKVYWEGVVQKYKGYRDGYFQLALVEYRLKNKEKAKEYLHEVFLLDPNFEEGRKLEEILEAR